MNGGQKLVVDQGMKMKWSRGLCKKFTWVKNWIERHFFNKVSDTLYGIIFMSILLYLVFRLSGIKK